MNSEDAADSSSSPQVDAPFEALLREVARIPSARETCDAAHELTSSLLALPKPGDLLDGRYRIASELGRGGMGVVFAARNERTGGDVALKWMLPRNVMRSASQRAEGIARFVREARAISRIQHPNVVRIFDVGGETSAPYLVMEKLEGETLRQRLERGPLTWDEACRHLVPAMEAVAAAHRAGVIHRDLKPDNLFLSREGTKVLDFGVSQMRVEEDEGSLTRTGTLLGTPAFMPLEQLRGSSKVDARCDVYALGVIWYQALSGRLPFSSLTAADLAVLLATETPKSLHQRRPELRGMRSDVVMRALAREAGDRFADIDDFIAAVQAASGKSARRGAQVTWAALLIVGSIAVAQRAIEAARPAASPASVLQLESRGTDAQRARLAPIVLTPRELQHAPERPVSAPHSAAKQTRRARVVRVEPLRTSPPMQVAAPDAPAVNPRRIALDEFRSSSAADISVSEKPPLRRDDF